MRVSHVHACSERYSSTLSSPFHPTSSSPHSSSISCSPSCSPSCTSSTNLRAVVTLRTSPKRRWTQLTNPTSAQAMSTRHKNTKDTQYITHISKLSQSTSCAISSHAGVKTCRVAESRAQHLPQNVLLPTSSSSSTQ